MSVFESDLTVKHLAEQLEAKQRELEALRRELATWQAQLERAQARDVDFTRSSGTPVAPVYTPLDAPDLDYGAELGLPGQYPFTRGVHATGYRGRLWTMRQFSGFGTAEETNARYKFLLSRGQTGLSVAFDFPTLMGYDSDHPRAAGRSGEVRRGDLEPGRHGDPVRRDPARAGLHVDDDQRPGRHAVLLLRRGGREAGRDERSGCAARCRTTS